MRQNVEMRLPARRGKETTHAGRLKAAPDAAPAEPYLTNEKTFDNLRSSFKKWAIYDYSGNAPVLYSESEP
jgi:hypothetical protein